MIARIIVSRQMVERGRKGINITTRLALATMLLWRRIPLCPIDAGTLTTDSAVRLSNQARSCGAKVNETNRIGMFVKNDIRGLNIVMNNRWI